MIRPVRLNPRTRRNSGELVQMDFRSGARRKVVRPHISDCFVFSGSAGQLAVVLEMRRGNEVRGGEVVYEQYVKMDGEWVQDPAHPIRKSLLGFNSKYTPFRDTIEHLRRVEDETAEDEAHMERVMAAEGFPDYQNRRHDMKSDAYMNAFKKAMGTMPSVMRALRSR